MESHPMKADSIDYEILGEDFHAVVITLDPGEAVQAEPGALMFMEEDIDMGTSTGGGLLSGLKRKLAGERFFVTSFENEGDVRRKVGFASEHPGNVKAVDLSEGTVYCQRDAFLCCARGVTVSVAFTKRLGAGFFGGEGFVLQKLQGDGLAFMHAGGHVIERRLAPRERLRIDTGCLVGFDETVDYSIKLVGGVTSKIFGGEGLFLASLEGPGRVWMQTMPFSRFADRVVEATQRARGES
ncbi:MAG: TIGR00266 family protein [Planctomycetota bacterium]|nr:TIGR00266 family protein [Planctomycetota bacterium]